MGQTTRQRQAIHGVIERAGRPLGAREVLQAAQREVPTLGLATVYRAIKELTDAQAIRAVVLPGAAPRYEMAGKDHHHHFHCRTCDGLFEIEGCVSGAATLADLVPEGFTLDTHEVILYGRCATCCSRPTEEPCNRVRACDEGHFNVLSKARTYFARASISASVSLFLNGSMAVPLTPFLIALDTSATDEPAFQSPSAKLMLGSFESPLARWHIWHRAL